MDRIRCIIIDDEKIAREGVSVLLLKDSDFELVDTCANGSQALKCIVHYEPELIFLDIQMPDFDGFELLKRLPSNLKPLVIFITAYDQYAKKAFEANAFDYLLKPFDDERFYTVLSRTKKQISLTRTGNYSQNLKDLLEEISISNSNVQKSDESILERIMIKREGGVTFIDVREIIAFEAFDYYIKIITNIDEHMMRKSLNSIENKLEPNQFIRIHRSSIINVNYIKSIEKNTSDEHIVIMNNGNRYRMSKSGRRLLKNKFLT